ncbi:effector-associated domain EAD1-containing protein [Scytonema hofmannii]|nr:effector-associated domain EAD1-containing protein [Scytonema hofmannii]
MELTGKQREQLKDALISAFPDKSKLEQMVDYKLDKRVLPLRNLSTMFMS